jgi:hypothetical protein
LDDAAAARASVEHEVAELERLCVELERSLVAGDWNAVGGALRSTRRSMHAFLNAMDASSEHRDEAFDKVINKRMRRVYDVREDQLTRLRTFNAEIGGRLQTLSKWKRFAGSIGSKRAPSRSAGLDRTT